jgi:hypothetical protein
MAAKKKQKQLISQRLVGVATTGMPSPIRNVLKNRYVAVMLVALLPVLLATGVVTIDREHGFPWVAVHPAQLGAAKAALTTKIQQLRGGQPTSPGYAPLANGQPGVQPSGWPQAPGYYPQQAAQTGATQAAYPPAGNYPGGYAQGNYAQPPQGAPSGWNNGAAPNAWGAPPQGQAPQQATNPWGQPQPAAPTGGRW